MESAFATVFSKVLINCLATAVFIAIGTAGHRALMNGNPLMRALTRIRVGWSFVLALLVMIGFYSALIWLAARL